MTRTRIQLRSTPLVLLAAASLALVAYGTTRWFVADDAAGALPPLTLSGDTAAAAAGALDASKLFASRAQTVVTINSSIGGAPTNGAGVVIDRDGTIVTASHVVVDYQTHSNAESIYVHFRSRDAVPARIVALDQFNDLAILQIDPTAVTAGKLVAAPFASNSDSLLVGSEVAAIGDPMGLDGSLTTGIVSAVHRVHNSQINGAWRIPDLIQHDASINQGNSGGPLFNARGQIVGINQQISTPTGTGSVGLSLAVSSNIVQRVVREWKAGHRIEYADLGIATRDISPQLAAAAHLGTSSGAMVQNVALGAAQAGLRAGSGRIDFQGEQVLLGDVIVELAGQPITSSADFARVEGLIAADQPVKLTYVRGKIRTTVSVTAVPRPIV